MKLFVTLLTWSLYAQLSDCSWTAMTGLSLDQLGIINIFRTVGPTQKLMLVGKNLQQAPSFLQTAKLVLFDTSARKVQGAARKFGLTKDLNTLMPSDDVLMQMDLTQMQLQYNDEVLTGYKTPVDAKGRKLLRPHGSRMMAVGRMLEHANQLAAGMSSDIQEAVQSDIISAVRKVNIIDAGRLAEAGPHQVKLLEYIAETEMSGRLNVEVKKFTDYHGHTVEIPDWDQIAHSSPNLTPDDWTRLRGLLSTAKPIDAIAKFHKSTINHARILSDIGNLRSLLMEQIAPKC